MVLVNKAEQEWSIISWVSLIQRMAVVKVIHCVRIIIPGNMRGIDF